ncbi:hypothetical protein AAKU55_003377 [Oxalobacteraceae bacterium GrIS 1.11]
MDEINAAESLGFTMPTPAYLAGALLFGMIGFAAYRYGAKTGRPHAKWLGLALMLYPYVISATWLMYLVGAALCAGLYWFRE